MFGATRDSFAAFNINGQREASILREALVHLWIEWATIRETALR